MAAADQASFAKNTLKLASKFHVSILQHGVSKEVEHQGKWTIEVHRGPY
jgi:hypothetical protein